jgi:hypothetical protein
MDEELTIAAAYCLWMKTRKKKRRMWAKQWLLNRVNNSRELDASVVIGAIGLAKLYENGRANILSFVGVSNSVY